MEYYYIEAYCNITTRAIDHSTKREQQCDERSERYKVTGNIGEIELESNRPFFRGKGLKHRSPDWKQVKGKVLSPSALRPVSKQIRIRSERLLSEDLLTGGLT